MGRDLILGKRGPRRTAKPRTARYRALDGTKRSTCAEMVGKALLVGVCGLLLILVVVAYAVLDAAGLAPSSPLQPMGEFTMAAIAASLRGSPPPTPPSPPRPPTLACEWWCETPKHLDPVAACQAHAAKCGACAWCGEAAAGELLPAVYLPPPSPLPSPPPPLASWTETAETGASAAPGNDGSLSLSSSLAASASRIGARSNLTSLSSLTQVDLHELHHAVTDELTKEALDAPLAVGIALAVVVVLLCSACFCACLACRARGHARPSTYGHTRAALDEFDDDDDTEADFEMARRGRVHHGGRRNRRGTQGVSRSRH